MLKKALVPAVIAGFTVGSLAVGGVASAHHPEIVAEVVCADDGGSAIEYTATAWAGTGTNSSSDSSRGNSQVDIAVDGSFVEAGAFAAPTYSFSGSIPLPAGAQVGDVLTVSATAVSDWDSGWEGGESRSASVTVPELECDPPDVEGEGRFTGGGHQIRVDGVRVTRGLTIHCDLVLSNNLEINWNGNQFHMLEHLTTVACTDDPDIIQAPPPAPLDTLIGTGEGRYNGDEGFSIEFTLVDHGEPGRDDQMAIYVYETANPSNVVLDVPLQTLSGGNLQAHYDQPHK
ncbi:hypothetical protein [Ilumatobacter sp.]|uniref:hypothetical protein n=1 Tax=Ilumatobacter sp. TaxID=1967498 RepID=UPI003AF9226B